jgi:hypothetical protein
LKKGQLTLSGRDGQPLKTVEERAAERERLAAKLRELGIDPESV